MVRRFLFWLSGRLPCRIIRANGRPYLERYYVGRLGPLRIYLHRFVAGDVDRHPHDHPWRAAVSVILAGAYREMQVAWLSCDGDDGGYRATYRTLRPGRVNMIRGRDFHRIVTAAPETWTLFVHTPRVKGWGFLVADMDGDALGVRYVPVLVHNDGWERSSPRGAVSDRVPLWGGVEDGGEEHGKEGAVHLQNRRTS